MARRGQLQNQIAPPLSNRGDEHLECVFGCRTPKPWPNCQKPWPVHAPRPTGRAPEGIQLQLTQSGSALALAVLEHFAIESATPPTPVDRVRQTLAQLQEPAPLNHLRKPCGMRTAAVCSALTELSAKGEVVRDARGYQLKLSCPVSRPIDPQGNGNGRYSLCSSGG